MIRRFIRNLGFAFSRFMYGRNGLDSLGQAILIAAVVLSLLSNLPYLFVLSIISTVLLGWEIFRFCSKNLYKRSVENQKYLSIKPKIVGFFATKKKIFKERKTHKYIKCKICKQGIRLPRGRGKIEVTCPKCHTKFVTKT